MEIPTYVDGFCIHMMVIIFRIDLFVQVMNINEQSLVIGVSPSVLGGNKFAISAIRI